MENRFAKLMAQLGPQKQQSNPGVDNKLQQSQDVERQLAQIDQKIEELQASNDPNSLESLNFWKQQREKLSSPGINN